MGGFLDGGGLGGRDVLGVSEEAWVLGAAVWGW